MLYKYKLLGRSPQLHYVVATDMAQAARVAQAKGAAIKEHVDLVELVKDRVFVCEEEGQ